MTLADLVAGHHDWLVERFADEARRHARAAGLDRVELIDSMPFFLDDLVDALSSGARFDHEQSAAASHGFERLAIGFRIDRVVSEYILIGDLIFALAEQHGYSPTSDETRRLLRAVGEGAAIGAGEYIRRREAELLRSESEHASFLAHEVRNSLASARFAFDLLQRRDFADAAPLVRIVDDGLRQAGTRIDDTLAGARARGGVISPVRLFPRTLLDEIAAHLRPQAQARQIEVTVEAAADLAAKADPRLLRSALENLASNGVKFSQPGGTVALRVAARGDTLVFEVADACGGIEEGKLDRLFRPFVQAGQERSGFGLGLAIARECAEAQGGSLELTNAPGHGCVFTLTLPLQP